MKEKEFPTYASPWNVPLAEPLKLYNDKLMARAHVIKEYSERRCHFPSFCDRSFAYYSLKLITIREAVGQTLVDPALLHTGCKTFDKILKLLNLSSLF